MYTEIGTHGYQLTASGGKIAIFETREDAYLDYNENPMTEYKGYTTFDGGLGYRVDENLTLRLVAGNLMDYDGLKRTCLIESLTGYHQVEL